MVAQAFAEYGLLASLGQQVQILIGTARVWFMDGGPAVWFAVASGCLALMWLLRRR